MTVENVRNKFNFEQTTSPIITNFKENVLFTRILYIIIIMDFS